MVGAGSSTVVGKDGSCDVGFEFCSLAFKVGCDEIAVEF